MINATTELPAASAGRISINDRYQPGQAVRLEHNSRITVDSASGEAGDIAIYAGKQIGLFRSALTTSSAQGAGSGGNIELHAALTWLNGGQIHADAALGQGGLVKIISQFFLPSTDSNVTASSASGEPELQGVVSIQSQYSNIASSLAVLPDTLLAAGQRLNDDCAAAAVNASSFTVGGLGILPLSPETVLNPDLQSLSCGESL